MKKEDPELLQLIKRLEGKAVIVEGKKDRRALEELGVTNIFSLNSPLFSVVEEVAAKFGEAAVLTDLDREGKQLYGKLSKDLKKSGVKVDDSLRNFLFKKTKLRQIEGLLSLAEQ